MSFSWNFVLKLKNYGWRLCDEMWPICLVLMPLPAFFFFFNVFTRNEGFKITCVTCLRYAHQSYLAWPAKNCFCWPCKGHASSQQSVWQCSWPCSCSSVCLYLWYKCYYNYEQRMWLHFLIEVLNICNNLFVQTVCGLPIHWQTQDLITIEVCRLMGCAYFQSSILTTHIPNIN